MRKFTFAIMLVMLSGCFTNVTPGMYKPGDTVIQMNGGLNEAKTPRKIVIVKMDHTHNKYLAFDSSGNTFWVPESSIQRKTSEVEWNFQAWDYESEQKLKLEAE